MKTDVLCVGPAYAEIVYTTKTFEVSLLPERIRTLVNNHASVEANEVIFGGGGGGYIAALTCARLGLNVALATQVGQDNLGCELLRKLSSAGVHTEPSEQTTQSATSICTLLRSAKDDLFAISSNDNKRSYGKAFVTGLPSRAWLYLSGPFADLGDLKLLLSSAAKAKTLVAIRLTSRDLSNARRILKHLAMADICFFDRDDAEMLTHQTDVRSALGSLRASGLKTIVVLDDTKYAHGLHDGFYYETKQRSTLKRINETGMSEAFAPAFLASYLREPNFEDALSFGLHTARSVAHFVGSEAGIPKNIPQRHGKVRKNFI